MTDDVLRPERARNGDSTPMYTPPRGDALSRSTCHVCKHETKTPRRRGSPLTVTPSHTLARSTDLRSRRTRLGSRARAAMFKDEKRTQYESLMTTAEQVRETTNATRRDAMTTRRRHRPRTCRR